MSAAPSPRDAEAVLAFARAAARDQEEAAALPLVEEALRLRPDHARLWEAAAALHRGLDELAPAMAAGERAAALMPGDLGIVHGLARLRHEAGEPAEALFREVLALSPDNDAARHGLVSAVQAERGLAAAIDALAALVEATPLWIEGQARLANLRWQAGERDGFAAGFEQALAAAPRMLALRARHLGVLLQAGRFKAALDAARRGRDAAGAQPWFDGYEAAALAALGDLAAADRLYAAIEPIRDPALALHHLTFLFRQGRIAEAAALAESWSATAQRGHFLSYLAAAWRALRDPRWEWLEGDARLIGVYDLGEDVPPLEALAAVLRRLHRADAAPLDQSLRGGTQTEGALFARPEPEIGRLRAAAATAVRSHIEQLPAPDPAHPLLGQRRDRPVRFAGSWSVRLSGAGHHVPHRHPLAWLSSAFYVSLPDEAESGPPPAGWLALGEPPAELGLDLAPLRLVEPKPGRLVLFPSTMWHGTRPFAAGERLTVAFDVAPPHPAA